MLASHLGGIMRRRSSLTFWGFEMRTGVGVCGFLWVVGVGTSEVMQKSAVVASEGEGKHRVSTVARPKKQVIEAKQYLEFKFRPSVAVPQREWLPQESVVVPNVTSPARC